MEEREQDERRDGSLKGEEEGYTKRERRGKRGETGGEARDMCGRSKG